MNVSIGIIIVFVIIGILAVLATYRFITQRRQLSSGRNIGSFPLHKEDGRYVLDVPVSVTVSDKWCRLLLRFRTQGTYQIDMTPKYFFNRVAFVTGTPYSLSISDTSGHILFREEDSLTRFIAWLGGSGGSAGTLLRERGNWSLSGTVTLLEFLPAKSGSYRLSLHIQSRIDDTTSGSSSRCEVTGAELTIMEDVIPLSKTVRYPHNRVRV